MINQINQEIDRRKLTNIDLTGAIVLASSACHGADMLEGDNGQLVCSVCRRACEGAEG